MSAEIMFLRATAVVGPQGVGITKGVLGGRLKPSAFLRQLGEQRQDKGDPLRKQLLWPLIHDAMCNELDLPATIDASATEPCETISFAVEFDFSPVLIAREQPFVPKQARCADVDAAAFECTK